MRISFSSCKLGLFRSALIHLGAGFALPPCLCFRGLLAGKFYNLLNLSDAIQQVALFVFKGCDRLQGQGCDLFLIFFDLF